MKKKRTSLNRRFTGNISVLNRETREGWPLLTVETEKNGNSKTTTERGPSLVGSLGLPTGTRNFCSTLAVLVGPVQKGFFSPDINSIPLPHHPAGWAGSRAGSPVS